MHLDECRLGQDQRHPSFATRFSASGLRTTPPWKPSVLRARAQRQLTFQCLRKVAAPGRKSPDPGRIQLVQEVLVRMTYPKRKAQEQRQRVWPGWNRECIHPPA